MPVPGLIDTYAFADWMKVDYKKAGSPVMLVRPENGGLLTVLFTSKNHGDGGSSNGRIVDFESTHVGSSPAPPTICCCVGSKSGHDTGCPLAADSLNRAIAEAEEAP